MKPTDATNWLARESNIASYLKECADEAARPDGPDRQFRHGPALGDITENRPPEWVDHFWQPVCHTWQDRSALLAAMERMDAAFPPPRQTIVEDMTFGAATIAYAFHLSTIRWVLGGLPDGLRIAEIGGGYGGLASLVQGVCCPKSYTIFDIEEPSRLQRSFLRALDFQTDMFRWPALGDAPDDRFDVAFSIAALSELNRATRDTYVAGVLAKADYGLVQWSCGPQGASPEWLCQPAEISQWFSTILPGKKIVHAEVFPGRGAPDAECEANRKLFGPFGQWLWHWRP